MCVCVGAFPQTVNHTHARPHKYSLSRTHSHCDDDIHEHDSRNEKKQDEEALAHGFAPDAVAHDVVRHLRMCGRESERESLRVESRVGESAQ